MFKYVKPEGKAKWELIPEGDVANAATAGHRFETILSLDRDVDATSIEGDSAPKYRGPLYFDLDSDDEESSLYDLRRLLISLYWDYGVDLSDINIWASGGKGFHVVIPSKVFIKSGTYQTNLAYTYKNMALQFDLTTLDYSIYSQGKGRMWRIENQERPNGRFKVPLSAVEAMALPFPEIKKLTESPRHASTQKKELGYSPRLAALYKGSTYKAPKTKTFVSDETLGNKGFTPECITKLLAFTDVNESKHFNQLAMVIAGYATGKGIELPEFKEMTVDMAKAARSDSYKTARDKQNHLVNIYKYFAAKEDYHFSCEYAKAVVDGLSCGTCPVNVIKRDSSMGIEEIQGCMYKRTMEGSVQISTFTIKPLKEIIVIDGTREERRLSTELTSVLGNKNEVTFAPQDMLNKSAFMKKLPGPAYAFVGGDVEVPKWFFTLASMEVPKQKGVSTLGLHQCDGEWHFVSHGGSLSGSGKKDELMLTETDITVDTALLKTERATQAELTDIATHLFNFNVPNVALPIVGWHVAAMYKERLFKHLHKFPLLFIFGEAGAGKTTSAMNIRRLYAISEEVPLKSAGDITSFTLVRQAARANLPMYIDEYKASSFSQTQVKNISKAIRAAYQNEEAERGKSDQSVIRYAYKSPMVFIGEQTVFEKAAKERIVEVQMITRNSRKHQDSFEELEKLPLEKLGRLLLEDALAISDDELMLVFNREHNDAPPAFKDRPRVNHAVVLTGLRLLERVLNKAGVAHSLGAYIAEYQGWKENRQETDFAEYAKSDVDRIFEVIAIMTRIPEPHRIVVNEHFKIKDGHLFIQMRLVYQMYMQYSRLAETDAERMNFHSFSRLLKEEAYYRSDDAVIDMLDGSSKCYVLNIDDMLAKKMDIECLASADNESGMRTPLREIK